MFRRAMVQKTQEHMSNDSSSTGWYSTLSSDQSSYTLESNRESESNFRVSGWDGSMHSRSFTEQEEQEQMQQHRPLPSLPPRSNSPEGYDDYDIAEEEEQKQMQQHRPLPSLPPRSNIPEGYDEYDIAEEEEEYVEIDPREQYKDAKPTQTSAPQSFLPTNIPRRRSLGNKLKVHRRLSLGRKPKPQPQQGGRAGARPMTMAQQAGSNAGRPAPRPMTMAPTPQRVQAAVHNVQTTKSEAVKNVAKSFESRANLARAKAKPVQAKFKANERNGQKEATNPMYRS